MSCSETMEKRRRFLAKEARRKAARRIARKPTKKSLEVAAIYRMAAKGRHGGLANRQSRIETLLLSPDDRIRLETERFLFEHEFGKAKQSVEHSGELGSYAIEVPKPLDRDTWITAHTEAQEEIAARAGQLDSLPAKNEPKDGKVN